MASQNASMTDQLNALTGCSICQDDCNDPRALPCMHNFCLTCLKNLTRRNFPGDRIRCPMCRKKFYIPRDGVGGLPKNPIVSRIIEINNISRTRSVETDYDKESTEREKLKKNAEEVSLMIADGLRSTKLRRRATFKFIERNKQEREKEIEKVNLLLDDMDCRRFNNLKVVGEEKDKMDEHLETLERYRDHCVSLAEKGSASEISLEVRELNKRLRVLEETHGSRILHEFCVRQDLLENKEIDGRRWRDTAESVEDYDASATPSFSDTSRQDYDFYTDVDGYSLASFDSYLH